MREQTGIIILAAGSSSRLGKPKQLLSFNGKSLIRHITEQATHNPQHHVIVVLGAAAEQVLPEISDSSVRTVINTSWQQGMSSSIRIGLHTLLEENPNLSQCIISVCDQPLLTSNLFEQLKVLGRLTGKGIITTGFDEAWGVPVLFSKQYFQELLTIDGQQGAKKIIQYHLDDMRSVPFDDAGFDIDTKQDYYKLKQRMINVEVAKEIINFHIPKPQKITGIPLREACGYTLATDVTAQLDIPNFPQSSMDGYAIRHQDYAQELPVMGKIPAGNKTQMVLPAGSAMRIFTGAPLPQGADTVVMQENVELSALGTIRINAKNLRQGDNVRPKGSEVAEGSSAMPCETYLTPAAIGYLAGIGTAHLDIYKAPRVGILLTGDELKPVGEPLKFGEVYESNSYQLRAVLQQLGVQEIDILHAPDDPEQLSQALKNSLAKVDVQLLVGGVSVGEYDFVANVAQQCGVEERFHRIRQKPGKPLFFGTHAQKLVFGLPGNPSSALSCFYLYVAPALEKIMKLPARIKKISAPITSDYRKAPGLTHFLKGTYEAGALKILHAQESYRLHSYAQANCLIVMPEADEEILAGSILEAYLL